MNDKTLATACGVGDRVHIVRGDHAGATGEVIAVSELPGEDSERIAHFLRVSLTSGHVEFVSPGDVRRV